MNPQLAMFVFNPGDSIMSIISSFLDRQIQSASVASERSLGGKMEAINATQKEKA
jgi:hypothetical protein